MTVLGVHYTHETGTAARGDRVVYAKRCNEVGLPRIFSSHGGLQ